MLDFMPDEGGDSASFSRAWGFLHEFSPLGIILCPRAEQMTEPPSGAS